MKDTHYDVVAAGTSFATTFFLRKFLERFPDKRVLVLERGQRKPQSFRIETGQVSTVAEHDLYQNRTPAKKHWAVHVTFGGNSNSWWACTPRFLPSDFEMKTRFGVGRDWPLTYDELEPYYAEAERLMGVSASMEAPWPRSSPPPLPPHLLSDAEEVWRKAHPGLVIPTPTARWSMPQSDPPRLQCCAVGVCTICPIDAKFTIENSMSELYERENVELLLEAPVLSVESQNGTATGMRFLEGGKVKTASADLLVVGTNAVMNPFLLQRSGIEHPLLGKRLGEQTSTYVSVKLGGLKSFNGSTSLTSQGFMLYDGEHRREHAAIMLEGSNIPRLRMEKGRWREVMHMKAVFEVLPDERNHVGIEDQGSETAIGRPYTFYDTPDEYTERAFAVLPSLLEKALKGLPVEDVEIQGRSLGEAHITGSTIMGDDPKDSVVDKHLRFHGISNLVVPGAGAFPTTPPANPTLTLSALSLWAGDHI